MQVWDCYALLITFCYTQSYVGFVLGLLFLKKNKTKQVHVQPPFGEVWLGQY